jgi:hypothetical protein
MTKKEIYKLSVEVSRGVLRDFFGTADGFSNMELGLPRKRARKRVYEKLEILLLDKVR